MSLDLCLGFPPGYDFDGGAVDPLLVDLVEFFKFNETSGDATGINGNVLTAVNNPGTIAGGRTFSAASTQRFTANDAAYQTNNQLTIAMRIWPDGGDFRPLVCKYNNSSAADRSYLIATDSNGWWLEGYSGGAGILRTTTNNFSTGAYHDIIVTFDGPDIALYCDNGTPATGTMAGNLADTGEALKVGSYASNTESVFFNGRFLSLGFWHRVFTADDRAAFAGGWEP